MNIDRVRIGSSAIDGAQRSESSDGARKSGHGRSAAGGDAISLSTTAKDVERLSNRIEQSRMDRLEQVRQAMASGTYRVPGADIARKLIELNQG